MESNNCDYGNEDYKVFSAYIKPLKTIKFYVYDTIKFYINSKNCNNSTNFGRKEIIFAQFSAKKSVSFINKCKSLGYN